jgi:hypothetical protein
VVATIRKIHPRLVGIYDRAYEASRAAALECYGSSALPQLQAARRDLEASSGVLSITDRAWLRGQQDIVDELIEQAAPGSAGAQ